MSRTADRSVSPPLLVALAAAMLLAVFVYARPLFDSPVPEDPGVSFDGPTLTTPTPGALVELTIPAEPRNPFRPADPRPDDGPAPALDLTSTDEIPADD